MDFVRGGAVVRIDVGALDSRQMVRAAFDERVSSGTGELVLDAPVTGELEVARTPSSVFLRGTVRTTATLICGRCLTVIERPLAVTFDEEFPTGPAGAEPAHAESGLRAAPNPVLDVTEVVRQHLLLAAPMAPLCRPDCRGLCPVCGADRNEADCGHEADAIDPRWAPLKTLKIQDRES